MKKFSVCLFVLTAFILLVSCGGGGGGGGGGAAGGSSSDGSSSAAGSSVTYSPGYTYSVPAIYQDNSYTGYLLRSFLDVRGIDEDNSTSLPCPPEATAFSTITQNTSNDGSQGSGKRFVQNAENWPMPKLASSSERRLFASVQSKTYSIGNTEKFWIIINFLPEESVETTFTLKKIGTHCRVWYKTDEDVSANTRRLTDEQLETIRYKLDSMFEVETALCGSMVPNEAIYRIYNNVIPITSETKLDIVVYSMTDNYLGYFYPRDLLTDNGYSNKAPIIYITSTDVSSNMYSTVSHEFDHLLNYIQKDINLGQREATWYTELMSNTIEEVLELYNGVTTGDSVRSMRLPGFLLLYNYGLLWNQSNSTPSYSNVYAFGAWLVRNYGGPELFHRIATNNYVNEASIVQAVNSMGYNETFESLRKKFAESLVYTSSGCGKPNFNKEINTTFAGADIFMPAINLMSIKTIDSASADEAEAFVNCSVGGSYYGPAILKPTAHFRNVYRYGFEIQKLGSGLTQIQIPSNRYGTFEVEFK